MGVDVRLVSVEFGKRYSREVKGEIVFCSRPDPAMFESGRLLRLVYAKSKKPKKVTPLRRRRKA